MSIPTLDEHIARAYCAEVDRTYVSHHREDGELVIEVEGAVHRVTLEAVVEKEESP